MNMAETSSLCSLILAFSFMAYSPPLKTEAIYFSETPRSLRTTGLDSPEDLNVQRYQTSEKP
jgi:hypothetical protein